MSSIPEPVAWKEDALKPPSEYPWDNAALLYQSAKEVLKQNQTASPFMR